jgi:hypothetical protein
VPTSAAESWTYKRGLRVQRLKDEDWVESGLTGLRLLPRNVICIVLVEPLSSLAISSSFHAQSEV